MVTETPKIATSYDLQYCTARVSPNIVQSLSRGGGGVSWYDTFLFGGPCFIVCSELSILCRENLCTKWHLIYLHVCYLVLFPVEALHLVLFQLLSGLHILVIVTLKAKIDLHGHQTGWHTDT